MIATIFGKKKENKGFKCARTTLAEKNRYRRTDRGKEKKKEDWSNRDHTPGRGRGKEFELSRFRCGKSYSRDGKKRRGTHPALKREKGPSRRMTIPDVRRQKGSKKSQDTPSIYCQKKNRAE